MDIFDFIRVLAKWWMIVVPVVLASVFGAYAMSSSVQPEYVAEASVLFVGPSVGDVDPLTGEPRTINPLLEQPPALATAAVITALTLNNEQTLTTIESEGLSTDFEAAPQDRTPVLLLQVRAGTRQEAIETTTRLIQLAEDDIERRQEEAAVPDDQLVTMSPIGLSAAGGPDYGGRGRLAFVILAIGGLVATALAYLLEGVQQRIRRSRESTVFSQPPAFSATRASEDAEASEAQPRSTVRSRRRHASGVDAGTQSGPELEDADARTG